MVPLPVLLIISGLLLILLSISFQQFCISPIKPKSTLALRIDVFLSLIFEIIINIFQIISYFNPDNELINFISYLFFWCLICSISFIMYKLINPPKLYETKKWAITVNRLWLIINITHCIWILFCFILFLMTNKMFYQYMYQFGFDVYAIFGSIIIIIISFHVYLTINNSIDKINKSASNGFRDYIYDDDNDEKQDQEAATENNDNNTNNMDPSQMRDSEFYKTSNYAPDIEQGEGRHSAHSSAVNKQLVDPMKALSQFTKAKYIVNLTIFIAIAVIALELISIYWISISFQPDPNKYSKTLDNGPFVKIDIFIFHYLFVFTIYISTIINNWYSVKKIKETYSIYNKLKQVKIGNCCCRVKRQSSLQERAKVRSNPVDKLKNEPDKIKKCESDTIDKTDKDKNENEQSDDNPVESPAVDRTLKLKDESDKNSSDQRQDTDSKDNPDDINNNNLSPKNHLKSPNTQSHLELADHRTLVSYTEFHDNKMELSQVQLSLNKINSHGQVIGRRGAAKPNKMKKQSSIERKFDKNAFTIVDYTNAKGGATEQKLTFQRNITDFNDDRESNVLRPTDTATATQHTSTANTAMALEDMLETMSMSDVDTTPITTVVFDFENVLCTKQGTEKLNGKLENFMQTLNLIQKELCFGGKDRLNIITKFLKDIHQFNGVGNELLNVKCFIISNESSKMIVKLLKDVNLLKYFVSQNPMNPNKFLSHVIGYDHKIAKESNGKKHLILLKLLQFLQRSHSEILYISHDKEIIEHLTTIRLCKTYLVETEGIKKSDFEEIQETCFL